MAAAVTENIEYEFEGLRLVGYLASDSSTTDRRPGVLVAHDGTGLDGHAKGRAERLAELGYVAFALDYIGGGQPIPVDDAFARLTPMMSNVEQIRALGRAGLEVLVAQPQTDPERVAAIGYCFGGRMVLELARGGADLRAVVGFHAGLGTTRPQDAANIRGSVLVITGSEDPIVPPEQREAFEREMRAAGVDWRLHLHGGAAHGFTNPDAGLRGVPGLGYHASTDHRSWRAMLDLFDETLGAVR